MSDTQTVHFRVGADAGILMHNIAQEHLLYSNDLDKAMRMFSESLGGEVPEDMVLKLLSGEMLLLVDEEAQMFNVVERKNYMHLDDIYPKQIDFEKFVADKQEEIDKHVDSLDKGLDFIINEFRYKTSYRMDIPTKSFMNYIYGKDEEFIEDIMEELEYDDDVQQMKSLIRITRDFIAKTANLARMVKRLEAMYNIKRQLNTYDLTNLAQKVQTVASAEFTLFTEGDDDVLNSYMEASSEIDAVLNRILDPVDIMDNYSAGWLSPGGDYYALNGEIANMLHTQLADKMQEQGMIPKHENNDTDRAEINPDAWLEQQGWVKIHGNNVQFGGCLNDKLGKTNVNMTKKQIEIIKDYIDNCHQCIIKAGWRLESQSISIFTLMAMQDPDGLNKKYFSFD